MAEYVWIGREYAWICQNILIIDRVPNMYHAMHGVRPLYKLMNTYWETDVSRILECFEKIVIVLTIFVKNSFLNFWEGS